MEREVWGETLPIDDWKLNLVLHSGDFTTAYRTAEEINNRFGSNTAWARDSSTVTLNIPPAYRQNVIAFLAEVEEIEVAPDTVGRVVINERTGTVVIGQSVRVATVAVAHGNLRVSIREESTVSQPPSFSGGGNSCYQDKLSEGRRRRRPTDGAARYNHHRRFGECLERCGEQHRGHYSHSAGNQGSGSPLYGELEII